MKKVGLLIIALAAFIFSNAQPCTPDPNWNTPGISPQDAPDDTVGIAYSTVITLVVPADSTIMQGGQPYQIHVDSAHVLKIDSIPRNFGYACDKPNRTWKGGEKGCAKLFGMADSGQTGLYHIWVYVITYFKIAGITVPPQFQRLDSSKIYFEIRGGWPAGVADINASNRLKIYPNPAKDMMKVLVNDMTGESPLLEIFDLTGRVVLSTSMESPSTRQWAGEVNISSLPKGMYMVKLSSESKSSQTRLVIE